MADDAVEDDTPTPYSEPLDGYLFLVDAVRWFASWGGVYDNKETADRWGKAETLLFTALGDATLAAEGRSAPGPYALIPAGYWPLATSDEYAFDRLVVTYLGSSDGLRGGKLQIGHGKHTKTWDGVRIRKSDLRAFWQQVQRRNPAVAVIERMNAPWKLPQDLSPTVFDEIPVTPAIQFTKALNILAFARSEPPEDLDPLDQAAERHRAARALFEAARDGLVTLVGQPDDRSTPPALIPREVFYAPQKPAVDDETAFERDTDEEPFTRFLETRPPHRKEGDPHKNRWRDVFVDRNSLITWIKGLPSREQQVAKSGSVKKCTDWLKYQRRLSGKPPKKEILKQEAVSRFGVTPYQFGQCYKAAAADVTNPAWGQRGRRSTKN